MKRVLIISPHFPPVNAADMQRVRQILPYLKANGWEAEVITADPAYIESYSNDELLLYTVPSDVKVHRVKAWNVKSTRRFGLGSLSMRSFFHFKNAGNQILKSKKFDIIYFSTTAFHVMALGPYWKRKFKIPFILDMQDPWRNDFYLDKPKAERPPKFFISYNIDKYLERFTVPKADGVISVSGGYCKTFSERYKRFQSSKCFVLPFGAMRLDFEIMRKYVKESMIQFDTTKVNIVYVGRGGHDMKFALQVFFEAVKRGTQSDPLLFRNIHCWFIGTSYASQGKGVKTVLPIAEEVGITCVTEITDRIPYFETLYLLTQADILFVPGSTDATYTASKIYPYVIANKPLLSVFHQQSSIVNFLKDTNAGICITFKDAREILLSEKVFEALKHMLIQRVPTQINEAVFESYSAESQAKKHAEFFDKVVLNIL